MSQPSPHLQLSTARPRLHLTSWYSVTSCQLWNEAKILLKNTEQLKIRNRKLVKFNSRTTLRVKQSPSQHKRLLLVSFPWSAHSGKGLLHSGADSECTPRWSNYVPLYAAMVVQSSWIRKWLSYFRTDHIKKTCIMWTDIVVLHDMETTNIRTFWNGTFLYSTLSSYPPNATWCNILWLYISMVQLPQWKHSRVGF